MTENASAEDSVRRRFLPWIGLVLAILILPYLIVSWLQVAGRPAETSTKLDLEGVWLIVRPGWLYPSGLLAIILLLVAVVAYPVAASLALRASWRALVVV